MMAHLDRQLPALPNVAVTSHLPSLLVGLHGFESASIKGISRIYQPLPARLIGTPFLRSCAIAFLENTPQGTDFSGAGLCKPLVEVAGKPTVALDPRQAV